MTNALPIQQLSQHSEKVATLVNNPESRLFYRYLYGRSADSRKNDDSGQDFVAFFEKDNRLAFALCDGVSQSFFGDLAASFIGNSLVTWMFALSDPRNSTEVWIKQLENHLQDCTQEASRKIDEYKYPENMAGMIQMVLEKKRSIGSESTFVSGVIDLLQGWYALAWIGDTRLRLWDAQGEITSVLGDTFHTRERWSSNKGLVGNLHSHCGNIQDITHLLVYSDGLSVLDKPIQGIGCSNGALDNIIEETCLQPNSDDTSLFEWWSEAPTFRPPLEKPVALQRKRPFYEWRPVSNATMYEIGLCRDEFTKIAVHYQAEPKTTFAEDELKLGTALYIRAWNDDEPGEMNFSMLESYPKDSAAEPVNSGLEISAAPQLSQLIDQKVSLPPKTTGIEKKPVNAPQKFAAGGQRDASSELPTGPVRRERKRKGSWILWIVLIVFGVGGLFGILWLSRNGNGNLLEVLRASTGTMPVPTVTGTNTVTPMPSQTPLPSITPESTPLSTLAETEAPTAEATFIESPQPQVEALFNASVIQAENIKSLREIQVQGVEKKPSRLLFTQSDEGDTDSWLALAIYGSDLGAAQDSEIYSAKDPESWNRVAILQPFELGAFTSEYAAGVVRTNDNEEIRLWSEMDGKWEPIPQAISPSGKTCALSFDETDLYTLDITGSIMKYTMGEGPFDEQEISGSWENPPTGETNCLLAIFEVANSVKYLVASSVENLRIVDLTNSNAVMLDSRLDAPITFMERVKTGWLVGNSKGFMVWGEDFRPAVSDIDLRYSAFSIHRAGEQPFLVALNASLDESTNCFYVDFSEEVPAPHQLDLGESPAFCNAENLYFSPDGKFIVTLSSEEGVMIWSNKGIE